MSRRVLPPLVLLIGVGVSLYAPEPWPYLGLGLVVLVVLGVIGAVRRPVENRATVDMQNVTVVECGPKPIHVIKVLREHLEPDPGAAMLESRLAATPSYVGQVPSTAAAQELAGRLERLQTRVTFRSAN
jgi:hypothetical protein